MPLPRLPRTTALLATLAACEPSPEGYVPGDVIIPTPLRDSEAPARDAWLRTPIVLTGVAVDHDGTPLPGATVTIASERDVTDLDGRFRIHTLRRNGLLSIDLGGYRTYVTALQLAQPLSVTTHDIGALPLDVDEDGVTRMLFGGDTALGRRYLDPDESTPRGEMPPEDPTATIHRQTAAEDTIRVLEGVKPFFDAADWRIINLETPVTDDPATPHETKKFAYFTLPDSLDALTWLGVEFVSLGNNHVYDYLEKGLADTLVHVDAAGLGRAGAGPDPDSAFTPWRFDVNGLPYSFVSATSIAGAGVSWPLYVADDTKGGAADLRDQTRVIDTITGEQEDGRQVIAIWHSGVEYTRYVTEFVRSRLELSADLDVAFTIAHHSHTAQGFSRIGDMFGAHSLGNFAMDQDRLDTMVSYTIWVDMEEDSGFARGAQILPHLNDDYMIRPATGELADRTLRDAGEVSDSEILVAIQGSHGWTTEDDPERTITTRTVDVPVTLDETGRGYVDLRGWRRTGESVSYVAADGGDGLWLGLDQMRFGTFEDEDVDDDVLETARWDWGTSGMPCVTGAYRGVQGFCLYRVETNLDDAILAFRERVRVLGDAEGEPNRDMTVLVKARADNAGETTFYTRFMASTGDKEFGDATLGTMPAGTYDWTTFAFDLIIPPDLPVVVDPLVDNPRAARLFVRTAPPERGESRVSLDDVAMVGWYQGPLDVSGAPVLIPNSADFVRLTGPPLETFTATITFTHVLPAGAALP